MSNTNNGGPAFPTSFSKDYPTEIVGGMTLRDYFAANAMPGLMGRNWSAHTGTNLELIELWAESSYAIADAMLRAREQTK